MSISVILKGLKKNCLVKKRLKMKDYHDLYFKYNATLLAVFEKFRNTSLYKFRNTS